MRWKRNNAELQTATRKANKAENATPKNALLRPKGRRRDAEKAANRPSSRKKDAETKDAGNKATVAGGQKTAGTHGNDPMSTAQRTAMKNAGRKTDALWTAEETERRKGGPQKKSTGRGTAVTAVTVEDGNCYFCWYKSRMTHMSPERV